MIKIGGFLEKYELNDENQTAKFYIDDCFFPIPRTVEFNSKEYLVTGIKEGSLHNDMRIKEHDVCFRDDIQIFVLEKNAFINSPDIQMLEIPQNLKELKDGWCNGIEWLSNISISPKNMNFKKINDNMIVSKSNQKSDIFDVLEFGYRNIEQIKIPSYIKRISPSCFSKCKNIKTIELTENSELISIGNSAFACSSIKYLHIPSKLKDLEDGWCSRTKNLINVSVSSENKYFKLINKKMIVGKSNSDPNNENFDVLKFACRDIEDVVIPSYIKLISSNCFEDCKNIETIEFNDDSKIETIEPNAFYMSSLESFYLPPKLKELKDGWCSGTENLVNVSISSENKYFKLIDKKMIVGKSNVNSNDENFDVLKFVCCDVEEIKIPSYIKYISPYCFENCKHLENVEFEKNSQITSIGNFAFSKSSIENITIPKSCKQISERAFFCCNFFTSIEFEENSELQTIDDESFSTTSLKSIKIPKNVKRIGKGAFYDCKFLVDVTFSENSELIMLEEEAFEKSSIISIKIPNHVNQIERKTFFSCKCLENVEFSPNSEIISIEDYSFFDTSINSICIPSCTKYIQLCAFRECPELKTVTFEKNSELIFIGFDAFCYSSIEKFVIPAHVKFIDGEVFDTQEKCQFEFEKKSELISLNSFFINEIENSLFIPESVQNFVNISSENFDHVFHISLSPENNHLKLIDDKMIVGKSNNEIFDVLIFACRDIESAKIPSYIKYISPYCFYNCKQLKTLNFQSDSELIDIAESSFSGSSIESITIPIHVKKIGRDAFNKCKKLKTFQILEDSELEFIDEKAFKDTLIESIYIPKNMKGNSLDLFIKFLNRISISSDNKNLKIINNNVVIGKSDQNMKTFDTLVFAFREIKNIIIPSYIRYIAPYCFNNCKNLNKVEFEPNSELISIGKDSFSQSSIESITIPIHVKKIESNAFSNTKELKTVIFSDNAEIEIIEEKAFEFSSITTLKFPDNLTTIESYTFYCSMLETIEFSPKSKLTTIKDYAFLLSSITEICIPAHVQTIGICAFCECDKLKTVIFCDNSELTKICKEAFKNTKIKKIIIPRHVKFIDYYAFYSCQNLENIEFAPNSELEIIGKYAFNNMQVNKVVIPKKTIKLYEGCFGNNEKLENLIFEENSELDYLDLGTTFNTNVKHINIPSKVKYLNRENLYNIKELEKVSISPRNMFFKSIDDQMIVEKSGNKFDTLYCACSKIKNAKIPSYIKHISSFCFEMIQNLETIEFEKNSKLKTIGKGAFIGISIKEITIPAGVKFIEKLFCNCEKLQTVNFESNSELKTIGRFIFDFELKLISFKKIPFSYMPFV